MVVSPPEIGAKEDRAPFADPRESRPEGQKERREGGGRLPGRAVPQSHPHHEPEVHGSDVDQVALASVLSSPQTQPPMAACFAGMREGAFDLLSPLAQELLAFGPTDASAI